MRRVVSDQATCLACGKVFDRETTSGTQPRKTCSRACLNAVHSATMARTNRKYCAARKIGVPLSAETRARLSAVMKARGHKPRVLGGNGRGPTVPEQTLASATGLALNVIVRTGQRGHGIPTHYKLDMAEKTVLLAVEVDGGSHAGIARKAQDAKKEAWLTAHGWTVLRFSNRQAMEHTEACALMVSSTISRLQEAMSTSPETNTGRS